MDLHKAFKSITDGLTSTFSSFLQKKPSIDYSNIINSFLPDNSRAVKPEYFPDSNHYYMTDLDGDSQNELITSYVHDGRPTTIVLKNKNNTWNKEYEIHGSANQELNYMGFADITGEGGKQLLVGYKVPEGYGELYGYRLKAGGKVEELFNKTYNRLEVINGDKLPDGTTKARLALWNLSGDKHHISLLDWNGFQLVDSDDKASYYKNNALRYYAQKVKAHPDNPDNWYYLAEALKNAGMYSDGLLAINAGMRLSSSAASRKDFNGLRQEILANQR